MQLLVFRSTRAGDIGRMSDLKDMAAPGKAQSRSIYNNVWRVRGWGVSEGGQSALFCFSILGNYQRWCDEREKLRK